ncbi:MAG TPA: MFS transporter [Solirubrobacterales bacterium]|jgi:EmrB/QacA subfamily drug resistance transporter|nr:MFS transporter [Solirubrobacterales bacterium]
MERKWWTLVLISIATFMLLLDITVVNVALPDIQRALGASLSSLQWVVDAYSLTLAAFLLTAGSLGDRLGRRRVFSIGFGIFTFASFLCGIAGDPTLLNLARGLQGVGGAAMFATSLALIGQEFHGADRATAFGVWGATIGGAVAIGPLVGGLITEHLGWEWIFFVNVPIGLAAIVLTERKLANVAAQDAARIDLPGLLTFSVALFLLIFGLIRGNPDGWGSVTILASLIGAGVLLLSFLAIELRSAHPMLDLALFRKPAFNGVSAVAFGLSGGMFAMFLYLTIYMQGVLGFSPLEAGLRFLPLTVLSFIASPIAGKLSNRIPIRVLLGVGLGTVGIGLLLMHGLSPDSDWTALLAGFLLAGVGIGIANPGIGQAAIAVVPPAKAGMGSGINTTFRQVGIATGVAGLGAIFQSQVGSKLSEVLPHASKGLAELVSVGGSRAAASVTPPGARAEVTHAATVAFVSGLNEILLIAAALSFVGAALGFALVRSSDFFQPAAEAEAATEPVTA